MKTIRASGDIYHLEEGRHFSGELALIIGMHRAYLVDCKIKLLEMYIEYRFSKRLNQDQLSNAKRSLKGLKNSPIELHQYQSIVDAVNRYSFIDLPNTIFYNEIDNRLQQLFKQTEFNFIGSDTSKINHALS
jgi:hypothetical protein